MDNQHQKIKGYRDLSQPEIDLMNAIKAKGEELRMLLLDVQAHLSLQHEAARAAVDAAEHADVQVGIEAMAELRRIHSAEPKRWLAMAQTDLQTGLMKLVRAVAQPTTF